MGRLTARDVAMFTVDDITFDLAPAPWPTSRPALDIAIEVLPALNDSLATDIIVELVETVTEQVEQLAAVRVVLSETLTQLAAKHRQVVHVRQQLADQRRADRKVR